MTVSQRIFEIMEKKNISQLQLSQSTQIAPSTISAWKTKNSSPSSDKITAIANCLGVSVSQLLGVDEDISTDFTNDEDYFNNLRFTRKGPNGMAISRQTDIKGENYFGNAEVTAAYESLSPTEKLEIQIEILKKADSHE